MGREYVPARLMTPLHLETIANEISHVLVSRYDHVGDLVLSVPFLRALRRALPQAEIAMIVRPNTYDVLKDSSLVDHLYVHNYRNMFKHYATLLRLRRWGVDLGIALANRSLDYKMCRHVGAKYRVGAVRVDLPKKSILSPFWLNHIMPVRDTQAAAQGLPVAHEVERTMKLAEFIGFKGEDLSLELSLGQEARAFSERLSKVWGDPELTVHLHPRWLRDDMDGNRELWKFADLVSFIKELQKLVAGSKIAITYGDGDIGMARDLRQALQEQGYTFGWVEGADSLGDELVGDVAFFGRLPLQHWAVILGSARCVVSPDTGAVHVAAALHRPVVNLHPPKNAPYSTQAFYPWQVEHSVIISGPAGNTIPALLTETSRLLNAGGTRAATPLWML